MHSSFAYRQFNRNFTCGDPTILPYELIHSRNRGTVGHNLRLPRAWQVLDVYASRLITLTTTGIWCTVRDTAHRTHRPGLNKCGAQLETIFDSPDSQITCIKAGSCYLITLTDRTPPHASVPDTITVTDPFGWTWDNVDEENAKNDWKHIKLCR
ncbi:hypothetical protein AVEN_150786-1 [Araneus ventricosus]|uniref:Uncharacterized protein n=1 Tax=Araneus ventricosus TaxID=182803 RepID=A0A4Y2GAG3_ARAVE|nr:hypothetical protein AVEN_150786-1 [Araneus ventricosus]